jgi:plasmid replication initiation protein
MIKREVIVEHNDLVSAHYDMSATEQNIFCSVLRQLQQEDPSDMIYRIYVKDLEAATNKNLDYQKIRIAVKKLLSRICTINRENGNILDVVMMSDAEYIKGAGVVEIGLSSKIRPFLFDMKKYFTKYRFHMFMALKSKYSKRMYKMLSQFKHTGVMRISVEELKNRLNLLDHKTGKEKYTEWNMFAAKVLEVSKRELQTYTDIPFTYTAKKTGRKFTSLEFKIQHMPQQLPLKFGEDKVVGDLQKRLTKEFGLSSWQANDIVVNVPEKDISRTLYAIKLKKLEGKVTNLGGFTAQTFENKYQLELVGKKHKESNAF